MTEPRTITMPWPPSLNRTYRAVNGRSILSKEARDYQSRASRFLPPGRVPAPLTGRLLVWMTLHPPKSYGRRKWDVANREKLLIDCLTHQRVWLDDSQIDGLVLLRGAPDAGHGRAELVIHTIEPGSAPL